MLLTNTQVLRPRKAFANGSPANKLSKTQLQNIGQSGGFSARLLGPVLKSVFPLIGNVLRPLAKSVLMPLGLAAAPATDAAIRKKKFGSGMTALIISNEEMNDTMKIVKSLEESSLLMKDVSKTIKIEAKNKKEGFLHVIRYIRC